MKYDIWLFWFASTFILYFLCKTAWWQKYSNQIILEILFLLRRHNYGMYVKKINLQKKIKYSK